MLQGTQEWLDFRRNGIGASDAASVLGISLWKTRYQLWEEKVEGVVSPMNSSMQRGQDLEETARKEFEKITGICVMPSVVIHPQRKWQYASLDGISFDERTIVEIKCPNKTVHEMAQIGEIPEYYMAQLQHQMLVCGLKNAYYFSFDGKKGALVEVDLDEKLSQKIKEEEEKFWNEHVLTKIPPKLNEKDLERIDAMKLWDTFLKT